MHFTLVCETGTDDDVASLLDTLGRHAQGDELELARRATSGGPGDMGAVHDAIVFVSENRELIETALGVFGAWLEGRFRPSVWTVSNSRREVRVEASRIDQETLELLSSLLDEEKSGDS